MRFPTFLTSFLLPVGTLIAAMDVSGIALDSGVSFALIGAFMTVKLLLEHLMFEPAAAAYVKAGRGNEFQAAQTLIFSLLGLGILALFQLLTR